MILSEHQRRAYLKALGIDVWVPRGAAEPDAEIDDFERAAAVDELDWDSLRDAVTACRQCALSDTRTQTVFGVGDQRADWMIIGEAPGAEEDRRGEPFVGRAGKLLDEMLRAVGLERDRVFIANILKCRPPNNRDPKPDESAACRGYLERQIALVQPKIILAVGRIAAQLLLNTDTAVGRLRGSRHQLDGTPVVVTYHPAYLLRSPTQKRKAWDDLQFARRIIAESTT
jgi:DNA polymerase